MENSITLSGQVLWAGTIGFLLGALIVWLIGRIRTERKGGHFQEAYDELKQSHADYKRRVNNHFTKTADAVDNLTQSYQEVFSHLSVGAEQLMDKETLELERKKRRGKAITLAYLSDAQGKETSKTVVPESVVSTATPVPEKKARPAADPASQNVATKQKETAASDTNEEQKSTTAGDDVTQQANDKPQTADASIAAVKRHLREDPTNKEDDRTP